MADASATFSAYVVRRDGEGEGLTAGVETLGVEDLPAGDVVVEVEWSGVNFKDGMVTVAGNRVARAYPLVPGVDLAGTVVSSDDRAIVPGAAVLCTGYDLGVSRHGGFAGLARVPATWVVPLDAGLSARESMVLGTAGFTAALSVIALEEHGLRPGAGPVLVTGASGGVGSVTVAILGRLGYEVVASSGKSAEGDWLRSLGAAEVIGRDEVSSAAEAGRVLGAERWAGAVDCVGGSTLPAVLRTLRYGAAVAASGLTGGTGLETTVYPFIVRSVSLLGIDSVQTDSGRRSEVWRRLATDLRPPDIELLVARTIGLDGLGVALDDIRGSRVRGRVLVELGR